MLFGTLLLWRGVRPAGAKSLKFFFLKKDIDNGEVVQDSQKKSGNGTKGEEREQKGVKSYPHIKIAKNRHF